MLERKEPITDEKINNADEVIIHIPSDQLDVFSHTLNKSLQLIKRENTTEIIVYMPDALEMLYHQRKKIKTLLVNVLLQV